MRLIEPGTLIESWENSLFWYTWDQSAHKELTSTRAVAGKQGLSVAFDFAQYEYPFVYAPLHPSLDLRGADKVSVGVFLPENISGGITVTPAIPEGEKTHEAPSVALRPGWNAVTANLNGAWLPKNVRGSVAQLQWILSAKEKKFAG